MYTILGILGVFAFRGAWRPEFLSFLYAVLLGTGIEAVQYYIPYRSFEARDIAINCLGAAAGIIFTILLRRKTS
jgi:VanZ family protein